MEPKIFLVVMICSSDALFCEDRSHRTAFIGMDACQRARSELRVAAGIAQEDSLVLSRCQYVMTSPTAAELGTPSPAAAARVPAW